MRSISLPKNSMRMACLRVGGEDLDHVAAHAEARALQHRVVSLVLLHDQPAHELAHVHGLAPPHLHAHVPVVLGAAQAVDARHGGDHDDVAPLHQGGGGGQAHPLDLLVDRGVLLDVQVLPGHVGLGLVVVVVGDEVLHGVVGEEVRELAVELGGEGLVVREDQGRKLRLLDDPGHREGLPRARDSLEGLEAKLLGHAPAEGLDRRTLVPCGRKRRDDAETGHGYWPDGRWTSLTLRDFSWEPRMIRTSTISPGLLSSRAPMRSEIVSTFCLSTATMMSPPP